MGQGSAQTEELSMCGWCHLEMQVDVLAGNYVQRLSWCKWTLVWDLETSRHCAHNFDANDISWVVWLGDIFSREM